VEVGLSVLREIEVDHDVDRDDVDSAREQVSADEASSLSILEVMENPIPVSLGHTRVDEETRIAQLVDLLGQQLHALGGVAENDCLRNV